MLNIRKYAVPAIPVILAFSTKTLAQTTPEVTEAVTDSAEAGPNIYTWIIVGAVGLLILWSIFRPNKRRDDNDYDRDHHYDDHNSDSDYDSDSDSGGSDD